MIDLVYDYIARRTARNLHLPYVRAVLDIEVVKDNKTVVHRRQNSKSFVRNAYNLLYTNIAGVNISDALFGAGKLSIKATSGTIETYQSNIQNGGYAAGDSDVTYGIVVGSGVNVESFEDFALQTPILNGNGAGQLNYNPMEPYIKAWNGGILTFSDTLKRYMNNNSGGPISVNEVALICSLTSIVSEGDFGPNYNFSSLPVLISRDKLGATITVVDTAQLKVTYIISLVYPV